ncbi:MAG: FkbM family methyltransferase [Planctomycetota bacterium]
MKRQSLRGHTFYGPLSRGDLVLDGGANHGEFAHLVVDAYGVECHSYEPNPKLRDGIAARDGLTLHPDAIGGEDGSAIFMIDPENSEASRLSGHATTAGPADTPSVEVPVAGLARLIGDFTQDGRRITLLKLDVEGAEYDGLLNTPQDLLDRVDQLTVEFHDHDQTMTIAQVREVIEHVEAAGFRSIRWSVFGHGDVGFVHRRRVAVPGWQIACDRLAYRYLGGVVRRFKRLTRMN